MRNKYNAILNKEQDSNFIMATVATVNPLTVKIYSSDTAISAIPTENLVNVSVGSRVLLAKYGNQFIATAIIADYAPAIGSGGYVKKETGTDRTSTTSSDDPDLTLTLPKNGIYRVEAIIFIDGTEAGTDFKWQYTQTGLTQISYRTAIAPGVSSTSVTDATLHMHSRSFTQDGTAGVVSAGWTCVLDIIYASTSSSDGTITLKWGCVNSSATISVKNNSVMTWHKIKHN